MKVHRQIFKKKIMNLTFWLQGIKRIKIAERTKRGKHGKEGSIMITVREIQIKSTMRYHLTPVRMATIRKSTNNAGEGVRKENPSTLLVGM